MRKILFLIVAILSISGQVGAENYIGRVTWNQSNVDALHGADKAAVARFVNATRPLTSMDIIPIDVVESGWASTGGGKSDAFVVLFDFSERGYTNTLWIYSRGNAGELKIQEIDGWKMGDLKQMARDLKGDGQDELIITKALGPREVWQPLMAMPAWVEVYRRENGEYVEASRDFSKFYDGEVLPKLDKRIKWAQARLSREPFQKQTIAFAQLEKYKILRVIGREPAAGLKDAYQWMDSGDSQLIQCAIATFQDIGGHEKELREAQAALKPALQAEITHRGG